MYSWETSARYAFKSRSFVLSIPYQHNQIPIIRAVKYIPEFSALEFYGTFSKNVSVPYIDAKNMDCCSTISRNEQSLFGVYNGKWFLEENAKSELR
jgi:hypothetical protein